MRTAGRSAEVVSEILKHPELFAEVFEGLFSVHPGVRMRSADALEKASLKRPELLLPFKKRFLQEALPISQQEVRWHVAQMLPRLPLTPSEKKRAAQTLCEWIEGPEKSRIVKVMALQALVDLAKGDPALLPLARTKVKEAMTGASPSIVARGNKLLKLLGKS